MTFEQADRLTERIIAFMRQRGGPYKDMPQDYLQWVVLATLAANQFVLRIDRQGIRYFACWFWLNDLDIERAKGRTRPENIRGGFNLYVAEVVSRGEPGDSLHMIRRIRKRCEHLAKNAYWHQHTRNNRLCRLWKEKT